MKFVIRPLLNCISNLLQASLGEANPNPVVWESFRLRVMTRIGINEVRQSFGAVVRVLDNLAVMLRNRFRITVDLELEGLPSLCVNRRPESIDVSSEYLGVRKNVPLKFELSKIFERWRNGLHFFPEND
jgi:hypothetical protein